MELFQKIKGFDWDEGNIKKNWEKHKVRHYECEEMFFNKPFVVKPDIKHSGIEDRFYALGRTDANRLLFIVFTIRKDRIRVISARDMNRKERRIYDEKIKTNTKI